jgi:hypothetical protein
VPFKLGVSSAVQRGLKTLIARFRRELGAEPGETKQVSLWAFSYNLRPFYAEI